jgi:hypothetical protein
MNNEKSPINQKLEDLSVDDELKEMNEEELLEELTKVSEELKDLREDIKPYNDDVEEENYDGDSMEIIVGTGECNSKMDDILKVMMAKDYEIPDNYCHYAAEL